jgi:hypothetical protein
MLYRNSLRRYTVHWRCTLLRNSLRRYSWQTAYVAPTNLLFVKGYILSWVVASKHITWTKAKALYTFTESVIYVINDRNWKTSGIRELHQIRLGIFTFCNSVSCAGGPLSAPRLVIFTQVSRIFPQSQEWNIRTGYQTILWFPSIIFKVNYSLLFSFLLSYIIWVV